MSPQRGSQGYGEWQGYGQAGQGYPGASPHPAYGAPQPGQPGQPGPYGAPMYPGGGYGQPPQGPRRRKVWPWIAVGCVVLLAAVGIPLAIQMGGSGEQAGDGELVGPTLAGEVGWQTPVTNPADVFGSWVDSGAVVTVTEEKLQAYSQKDGSETWSVTPRDAGGDVFCGASPTAEGGVGLVAFGSSKGLSAICDGVMLVDLKTGQPRWRKTMPKPPSDQSVPTSVGLGLAGDRAIVEHAGTVRAYGVDPGGEQAWDYPDAARDCRPGDLLAEGDRIAYVATCDDTSKLVLLNHNGDVLGDGPVGEFDLPPTIVSADPVVLSVETGELLESSKEFRTYDDQGRKLATIPETQGETKLDASPVNSQAPSSAHEKSAALVQDGLFVLPTVQVPSPDSGLRSTNKIMAFDVETGEKRWEWSLGSDITGTPFAAIDGGFLAINDGTYEKPPKIVRLATQDGSISPVGPPYQSAADDNLTSMSVTELTWSDGVVYGASMSASGIAPAAFALR